MISGKGLPGFSPHEDTYEVAIQAIFSVTGISVDKERFQNVQRHGKHSERIFAE